MNNDEVIITSKHRFKNIVAKKNQAAPHIDLVNQVNIRDIRKGDGNAHNKLTTMLKKIVESNNENFLSGGTNIVEYIISKNTGIPINEVKECERLSLTINDLELLSQFGIYLPNLIELKLDFSTINCISDLGSNFNNLKILQITNSKLKDLSGIVCFQVLEILDLSDNMISDLFDLEMCSSIVKLKLRNNQIEKEENISFLSSMAALRWLNLNENPIRRLENYRDLLKKYIPFVTSIDIDEEIVLAIAHEKINHFDEKVGNNYDDGFKTSRQVIDVESSDKSRPSTSKTQTNFFVKKQSFKQNLPNFNNLSSSKNEEDIIKPFQNPARPKFSNTGTKFFTKEQSQRVNDALNFPVGLSNPSQGLKSSIRNFGRMEEEEKTSKVPNRGELSQEKGVISDSDKLPSLGTKLKKLPSKIKVVLGNKENSYGFMKKLFQKNEGNSPIKIVAKRPREVSESPPKQFQNNSTSDKLKFSQFLEKKVDVPFMKQGLFENMDPERLKGTGMIKLNSKKIVIKSSKLAVEEKFN